MSECKNLILSKDGKRLVSGGAGAYIRGWDLRTGKQPINLPGFCDAFTSLALSPDETRLFSAGGNFPDFAIKIWDVETGRRTHTLFGGNNGTTCLGLSDDGRLVFSGESAGTIRMLRMADIFARKPQTNFDCMNAAVVARIADGTRQKGETAEAIGLYRRALSTPNKRTPISVSAWR